jgi:hypothetical protein
MTSRGKFVSLNYFIQPGFTDCNDEFAALCELLYNHPVNFIQLRNLNIDPRWYFQTVSPENLAEEFPAIGILRWKSALSREFPALKFGYFNPQVAPAPGQRGSVPS